MHLFMSDTQDLQPLLETQQNQLKLVFSDSDGIDTKVLAVLGANIAILIFIDQASLHLVTWQFVALLTPFVLSLLMDIFSIWPRKYLGAAPDLDQSPRYLTMDRETLLLQLLANTQAAITHNDMLNQKRLRACMFSMILTSLGFITLLAIL
jgi:hypothetical protein